MYHYKIFYHVEVFGGCKNQIFFIGDQNVGRGDRMAEVRRRSERHGDGFMGPGGSSGNLEAWRSFFRGTWRLCTPPSSREGGCVPPPQINSWSKMFSHKLLNLSKSDFQGHPFRDTFLGTPFQGHPFTTSQSHPTMTILLAGIEILKLTSTEENKK